jgi:uncharacterized membrane protein
MPAALKAGSVYFAVVYAIGFILGTARVLLLLPYVGETAAVLFETPLMLFISWIAARRSSQAFSVPATAPSRVVMGVTAFALLILGELGVSILVFGRSWNATAATYRSLPGIVGLSAQVIFALIPLMQAVLLRHSEFEDAD